MNFITEQLLTLPEDVLLIPVHELRPELRAAFECAPDDVALTRPGSRTPSRLVGSSGASLLREFRKPSRIVDAIVRFSRASGLDPHAALTEAFPLLEALVGAHTLVPADSEHARPIAPLLAPGQAFEGWSIVRTIQVFEDCEVHKAVDAEGSAVAIKLARPGFPASLVHMMAREAAILRHLEGRTAPRLLGEGSIEGRPYLVLSWCDGEPVTAVASRLRHAAPPGWRERVLALGTSVVAAYATLHEQGIVHGDVHPDNVLADDRGNVHVIDFGIGRFLDPTSAHSSPSQGGVPHYFDPRTASYLLGAGPPADGDPRDEQYRLAALVYVLVNGRPYLRFGAAREEFLRQIAEQPPEPFASDGGEPWPELEAVLRKALEKDRARRFCDTAAFGDALARVRPPVATPRLTSGSAGRALLARVLREVDLDTELFASGPSEAPCCSLNLGGAGIAYMLYRLSVLTDDARLLTLADAWSLANLSRADRGPAAFENPELEMTREMFSECSLHHDRAGLHFTQMLISQAMSDPATLAAQLPMFLHHAGRPAHKLDLTLGSSGPLLGAARLLESLHGSPAARIEPLRVFTTISLSALWERLEALPSIREAHDLPLLGVAHGWAGVLYAVLAASRALALPPPPKLDRRLDELEEFAVAQPHGVAFRGTIPGSRASAMELAPGWCAGAAGQAMLWCDAASTYGESRYLDLAEQCATFAAHHPDRYGDLCCGLAGRAHAALRLYQVGGDRQWLSRAHALAEIAAESIERQALRSASLYRGRFGVALLQVEIEQPELAAMPAFGCEYSG